MGITKTQGPKDQPPNDILAPNMAITKTQGPKDQLQKPKDPRTTLQMTFWHQIW